MDFYQADIGEPQLNRILPADVDWKDGVVIRSTNWLGDACMTLPAVHKIAKLLPEKASLNKSVQLTLKASGKLSHG